MFSRAALSVLAVAVVVSASPVALRPSHASSDLVARDFNCNVENVSCCEQIMTQHEAAKALGGLLVLPGDLIGNVGLSCSPIGAALGSKCKSTPVCCSQVSQSGLVNAGCTPLSVL